eukprot:scaffold655_cov225-Pinguiococcus_pyrenoidosus.AAC.15
MVKVKAHAASKNRLVSSRSAAAASRASAPRSVHLKSSGKNHPYRHWEFLRPVAAASRSPRRVS